MASRLVLFDSNHAAIREIWRIHIENVLNDLCNRCALQPLQTDPYDRQTEHTGDNQNGMKVGIQRDNDAANRSRVIENLRIRR